jgi:hypothetical protein
MATKKFIIEVDEGRTECEMCPYMSIKGLGCSSVQVLNCTMYNLATMRIKEYNEPNCYNLHCEARIPIPKEDEKE